MDGKPPKTTNDDKGDAKTVFQKRKPAQPPANDKTVVAPRKNAPKKAPAEDNSKTVVAKKAKPKQATGAPKKQEVALTQIRQSIVRQDSSRGFELAKKAANKALANNKIILNNRFVLEQTLGAGGMGTVYKAKDLRKIEANDANPYVAVKVLNEDFKNHPDAFISLQREASRSHILSHPNIVTVHDFDRDEDVIYMTMELLEGQPLDVLLRQVKDKGLPTEEAIAIAKDVCKALAYAHQKGIVHSDLKPGNIFITKQGAKILDFGIARLTTNTDTFDSSALGALTPTYASLDMIEGAPPDPSDDIYALGLIIYETISGTHPYKRAPADKVQEQKLKPGKLSELNKRQWAALEKCIKPSRKQRTGRVEDFTADFFEQRKFPIFKITTALLLIATGVLIYIYKDNDLSSRIKTTLADAEQCIQQQDYLCAIEKYEAVLQLEANNNLAQKGLSETKALHKASLLTELEKTAQKCIDSGNDVDCLKLAVNKAREIDAQSDTYQTLLFQLKILQTTIEVEAHIAQARECLSDSDYTCAQSAIDLAIGLDPTNGIANELKARIETELQQASAAKERMNKLYNQAVTRGDACMKKRNYQCAIDNFTNALEIRPNDSSALSKRQNAAFSLEKKHEEDKRLNKFISRGKACFDKKQYTCARTNAESALEFSPENKEAKALLRQTNAELNRIKQSLQIQ